jgi:hypothetical protein
VVEVNPWGPLASLPEIMNGSTLYHYQQGEQEALVALLRTVYSGGVEVNLQAMVGQGRVPVQVRQVMGAVENMALKLGADVLTLSSQHTAVARSAPRWGGHISGAVIRKFLKAH